MANPQPTLCSTTSNTVMSLSLPDWNTGPPMGIAPLPAASASGQRHASFTLNESHQVDKVVSDATISDCEFSPNNSDSNVNIKCSSGFYKAVAMPAFSTLTPGFSQSSREATITCSNIEPSFDYKGVEFNRIFWFSIRDACGVSVNVTIHLHHTTRLVQVQGSSILSDGSVAAVWFVKNLLLGLFLKLGKARGHDITAFNNAVLANNFTNTSVGNDLPPANNCPHCSKTIKKPAKPVKCFACKKTFHTTCHKQHPCNGTPSRPPPIPRTKRKASELCSLETSISELIDSSLPTTTSNLPFPPMNVPAPSFLQSNTSRNPPPPTTSSSTAIQPVLSLLPPTLSLSSAPQSVMSLLPSTRLPAFTGSTFSTTSTSPYTTATSTSFTSIPLSQPTTQSGAPNPPAPKR